MGGSSSKQLFVDQKLLEKDLSGKVYVVTGGNAGIGESTVRQLAKQGATIISACRSVDKAETSAVSIRKEISNADITVMKCDLSSLASVREFAATFKAKHAKLDCLVNNAGVMAPPLSRTTEGFEMQFGTNHVGHYLLTELLMEPIVAAKPSRIIVLSSCAHETFQGITANIDYDDINWEKREYVPFQAYGDSKLCNVLHCMELADRLPEGVQTASVHPGWVYSGLMRHVMNSVMKTLLLPVLRMWFGMVMPWPGVQTSLEAILTDDLKNGAYYAQAFTPAKNGAGGWPQKSLSEHATMENAKKLKEVTEKLIADSEKKADE